MDTLISGYATEDAKWDAVCARDRAADETFFYAVRSTGIYCRPSCPSRRAGRGQVEFYPTRRDAERAGFRPCRRCRPEQDESREAVLAKAACRRIEAALAAGEAPPALGRLAAEARLSPSHFQRLFRQAAGMTPKEFATAKRAGRAEQALAAGAAVTEAIYEAGYASPRGFYEQAAPRLGMAPRRFRDGGAGETIRFALGQCALGAFLIAATDAGLCAVSLGDDPDSLLSGLQERFANATLTGGDAAFEALTAKVVSAIEGAGPCSDLPLDIRGTAFQQNVWRALREIPSGRTMTYREIAARLGLPRAARAVAGACAANPLAVVVPCHRVVRTGGALSGYRWGIARKQALLDREASGG